MARKSRRSQQSGSASSGTGMQRSLAGTQYVISPEPETRVQKMRTAAYARLSVDKGDEDSIQTQVAFIKQYIKERSDLELTETYIDHGYTGTNFNRPEFNRMMEDVRDGTVQCIVVKDLSRFGRNFLEAGYYIETILPGLNVRFISINDDFDSSREADRSNIAVPIKNMVNAMYAKDFSKKATNYFELHSQLGNIKIERSTYGYSLDKERNLLIPNPETAPIVKIIFRWYLMGHTFNEIARRLNLLRVMTPYCYKVMYEEGKTPPERDDWNGSRVKTILENQTYAGDTVNGKRRKILYKNVDCYKAKREDWTIHENTHEALVSREDFMTVRERLDARSKAVREWKSAGRSKSAQFTDIFPQKVKCMECGCTMRYNRYSHSEYGLALHGAFYWCDADGRDGRCGQRVHEDYLKIVVFDQIKELINAVCEKEALLKKQEALGNRRGAGNGIRTKIAQADERLTGLYEDYVEGVISEADYRELKEHYIMEKQSLCGRLEDVETRERQLERKTTEFMKWAAELKPRKNDKTLDAVMADDLIESITVSSRGRIEVRFKCEDIFREIMEGSGQDG